jgi:hypothetical protein
LDTTEPSLDATRSPDKFIWYPVVIVVALCLLILVPAMLAAGIGFDRVAIFWLLFVGGLALLLATPILLIFFVLAVVRLHWRRAISFALAPGAFYGMILAVSPWTSKPPWSSVPSPSGAAMVTKTYGPFDEAGWYSLDLKTRWGFWSLSKRLLDLVNPEEVTGEDGATLAWTDDRHIVVGWPNGREPVHGLANVGDIAVAYVNYLPDPDAASAEHVNEAALKDVVYDFEEIDVTVPRGWSPEKQCVIHFIANDGVYYERVAVDVFGDGIGLPTDKYHGYGLMHVRFDLTKLQSGTSPLPTLTQAKLGSVFPTRAAPTSPQQQGLSLDYRDYTHDETVELLLRLKRGAFDVKVVLGFDKVAIVYHVAQAIDQDLISKFLACSSKTNIVGFPISLPDD